MLDFSSAMQKHKRVLTDPAKGFEAEQTPLISNRAVDSAEVGLAVARPASPSGFGVNQGHTISRPSPTNKASSKRTGTGIVQRQRGKSIDSEDVLTITSKQTKTRQRKNVGAFRRKRQDYATWRGRVGVHVEYDEFDLKKLMNVIYQTLSTEWELVDHYDVIR